MKLRFLAAAGPEDLLRAFSREGATAGLTQALDNPTLSVWTTPETPTSRGPDGSCAHIGLLFDRKTGQRVHEIAGGPTLQTRMIQDHWGAYVLFVAEPGRHCVLRDPSGSVPVYFWTRDGLSVYVSDAGMLPASWRQILKPDLRFIRHWLTFPCLRTARTGAAGLRELLPGTCRRAGGSSEEIISAWSPSAGTGAETALTDFRSAAGALRDEILRTVPRLAVPEEQVVLQLSGGLDSSIIGGVLAAAGAPFRALTFATRSADGDERRFARAAAAHYRVPLTELLEEQPPLDLESGRVSPFRPPPNPLLQPLHRSIAQGLERMSAGLVLDGAGGDNVFGYHNTASPALDAFRREGVGAALRAVRDIADLHRITFWSALRFAIARSRRPVPGRWRRDDSFLGEGAALAEPEPHPWLASKAGMLPGTSDHIRIIVGIHHFLADPEPTGPARLHPLLSQPVLELCLRIASWLWFSGGRDRAVARAAFRELVPEIILERRSKGRLESMFVRGYMRGRARLEPFLRDGRLAAAGIIDAEAVSDYMRRPGEPPDGGYIRLLEIAAAEQWLRSFGT